jgi:hypothetical protein
MNWEYQLIKADNAEILQSLLNKLGMEGWEALSATLATGEPKKVTLGQGMPPSMAAGALMWVALMKRGMKG